MLVAENPATGGAMGLAERVKQEFPQYDARVTILGHIQRGGSPSAIDRIMLRVWAKPPSRRLWRGSAM